MKLIFFYSSFRKTYARNLKLSQYSSYLKKSQICVEYKHFFKSKQLKNYFDLI